MLELKVSGMGCGSCVAQITRAIQGLDDAARVTVNRAEGRVSVETTESVEAVCQLISELGYPTAPLR